MERPRVRAPGHARPVAASNSVPPAISFQIQAVPGVEFDAFLFQQASLENVPAIAREAERHFALGVDDAVPRDVRLRVEALKDPTDKAGTSRHAGHRGDLAIGCHPTAGNAANHSANRLGGRIASQRDGRERLSHRKPRWLPTCRCRAFGDSRGRTDAGSRPFGRTFHAYFSITRALPPLLVRIYVETGGGLPCTAPCTGSRSAPQIKASGARSSGRCAQLRPTLDNLPGPTKRLKPL